MGVTATALRRAAGEFFGWWLGELAALVPAPVRRLFRSVDRAIVVTLDESHLELTRVDGEVAETIGRFATAEGADSVAQQELARIAASHASPRWRWGLYLDGTIVLRDLLRLPGAAMENYHEAVEYQIERQTPFKRSDVYFDCRPLAPADATDAAAVEFVVARRDRVDAALQRLSGIGIAIDFVTATFDRAMERTAFNLLPVGRSRRSPRLVRLNVAVASLAVLLAGLLVYLPMDFDRRTIAALSNRVEQLRTEATIAARLREQIETERKNVFSVVDRKRKSRPFTRILDDLTRLMPDAAWVSRLNYKNGTVRIVVHAPESESIVGLVEGSKKFSDARMITAVRRQQNSGRELFTLSFSAEREAGQ